MSQSPWLKGLGKLIEELAPVVELMVKAAGENRTYKQDLTMVAGWRGHEARALSSAVDSHVRPLSAGGRQTFVAHLERMCAEARALVRQHEASENSSWGGFVEDRIAYMMASLRTGARDPGFVRRLRELEQQASFFESVHALATRQ
jgi:hypothetical protein